MAARGISEEQACFERLVRGQDEARVRAWILGAPRQRAQHWRLQWAAWQGNDDEVFHLLMALGPAVHTRRALALAAERGQLGALGWLIPVARPSALANALNMAAGAGQRPAVELLLTHVRPIRLGGVLAAAAQGGQGPMVAFLMDRMNAVRGFRALCRAAEAGHLGVVQQLLPVQGGPQGRPRALNAAAKGGHLTVVEALLPLTTRAHRADALLAAAQAQQMGTVVLVATPAVARTAWPRLLAEGHWAALDALRGRVPVSWVRAALLQSLGYRRYQAQTQAAAEAAARHRWGDSLNGDGLYCLAA